MKNRFGKFLILTLILIMVFGTVYSSAFNSYDTYTYSIDGEPLKSPTAYAPSVTMDYATMNLAKFANGDPTLARLRAADMVTSEDGKVFIADKDNNRIVVLNKYYSAIAVVDTYVNEYDEVCSLKAPEGVYVTTSETADDEAYLYVCDTGNTQIVIFDENYNYVRTIKKPKSTLIDDTAFKPQSIAVDKYGRIFVVSPTCTDGVIVMSSKGDFTGFIGAQKVTYSIVDMIWKKFQNREQRQGQKNNVPVTYNNLTVDSYGFVYVTNSNIDSSKQLAAIKSKAADYSPVKKLNSAGVEIMKRNGFFDPGGEVAVSTFNDGIGVSKIIDVAIGNYGSWSILDKSRSRIFTYDSNGNLLFAFGDYGDQLGNAEQLKAITYHTVDGITYIISLDGSGSSDRITVYSPTEYCDTIMAALKSEEDHLYSESINHWEEVLKQNNNFDLAYIGIGKALYSQGKYEARHGHFE